MNKEELFQILRDKINSGEVSREEITSQFGRVDSTAPSKSIVEKTHFTINKVMYVLGSVVVLIGIIVFVNKIWDDIGSIGRIFVTLGFGVVFTAIGLTLLKSRPGQLISQVFITLGGLLVPGGAMVLLSEFSTGQDPAWPLAITFGVILLAYILLNLLENSVMFTFFAIANGTAFIFLLTNALTSGYYYDFDIYAFVTMIIGISYILLAYSFANGWNRKISSILYFFGTLGFLGAAYSRVFDSGIWQIVFFFIVIGGLYLSTILKNRSMLIWSTLFLIAHLTYITSKYFADSFGWPISLIFLGLVFIGLGYISININKRYIKSQVQ